MASTDGIRALARPLLDSAGLRLWDVEVAADVVRVLIDRDGGVDLDALSEASRLMSGLLDDHDELVPAGRYHLEVSSPGLERNLRTPEQYRQYLGATVTVKTVVAVDGGRRHRGVLSAAGEHGIGLVPETAPGGPAIEIPYDRIDRTRTVLDWGPAPKPGARGKPQGRRSDAPGARVAATSASSAHDDHKDRSR
jgi:ribosome maturation factor RimP